MLVHCHLVLATSGFDSNRWLNLWTPLFCKCSERLAFQVFFFFKIQRKIKLSQVLFYLCGSQDISIVLISTDDVMHNNLSIKSCLHQPLRDGKWFVDSAQVMHKILHFPNHRYYPSYWCTTASAANNGNISRTRMESYTFFFSFFLILSVWLWCSTRWWRFLAITTSIWTILRALPPLCLTSWGARCCRSQPGQRSPCPSCRKHHTSVSYCI